MRLAGTLEAMLIVIAVAGGATKKKVRLLARFGQGFAPFLALTFVVLLR